MSDTEQAFAQYVDDLEAQLGAARLTGGIGERERAQLDELIETHRSQIRAAEDEVAAQEIFMRFKVQAERFGQGAGMP